MINKIKIRKAVTTCMGGGGAFYQIKRTDFVTYQTELYFILDAIYFRSLIPDMDMITYIVKRLVVQSLRV